MKNIIVVDDFYKDPDQVRSLALETDFTDVRHLNYPGTQSEFAFYSDEMIKLFENLIGLKMAPDVEKYTFGKFRFMNTDTGARLKVHVDGLTDWTGLVYLNVPTQCEGGTVFYKHKKTGLEGPPSEQYLCENGYNNYADFENKIIYPDTLELNMWEETTYVGMRYNRLVLFKGNQLYHCHTHAFGYTRENSRLTQNFFFNVI